MRFACAALKGGHEKFHFTHNIFHKKAIKDPSISHWSRTMPHALSQSQTHKIFMAASS
jgi:hypothetical protein